jgi:hypothetical protein
LAQTDTTFTYQGELRDNGGLASGTFGIAFSLWNAASGGSQSGATIGPNAVQVTDGRFTVELDFGAAAFNNQSRFLEITVEGFTLSPRQPITRSPYSIQTRGIFVDDAGQIGIGTTSPQRQVDISTYDATMRLSSTNTETSLWSRLQFQTANASGGGGGGGGQAIRPVGSIEFQRPDGSMSAAIHGAQKQNAVSTEGYLNFDINEDTKLAISDNVVSSDVFLNANEGFRGSSNGDSPAVHGFASPLFPTTDTVGVRAENQSTNTEGFGLHATHAGSGAAIRAEVADSTGYAGYFTGGRSYFDGGVGIGTTAPNADARLTVNANGPLQAIHATSGAASWPTIYGFNGNTLGHVLHADGIADAKLDQGGVVIVGQIDGENLAIDGNEIMARNNGAESTLHLNLEGGPIVTGGRLGVGVNPGFAQLAVHDTDPGAAFGLEVETTQQSALPSIYASNLAGGPALWALGTSDVAVEGGGLIVAGAETGVNLAIDNNEIMARNNGQPAPLHLNLEGGDVFMGEYAVKPALAYARIIGIPGIVGISRSTPNVLGVQRLGDGVYSIEIEGGVTSEDMFVVTSNTTGIVGSAGIELLGGEIPCLCCRFYEVDSGDPRNCAFSLLIFRYGN